MHKAIAAILMLGLVVMGGRLGLMAQVPIVQQSAISGEAMDAGGRPLANLRVELFAAPTGQPLGAAIQATMTDIQGEWTFTNVEPGEYVVQIVVNDQVAGIPVSVVAGAILDGVLIVAPSSAVAAPAILGGPVLGTILIAGVTAATVATVVIVRDGS